MYNELTYKEISGWSLEELCEFLAIHHSDEDPIVFKGEETTVRDLSYELAFPSSYLMIKFYGNKQGTFGLMGGTVATMLWERMGGCVIHKTYVGTQKPTSDCLECQCIWDKYHSDDSVENCPACGQVLS